MMVEVWGDPAIWLARGFHVAAVLAAMGALAFQALLAPGLLAGLDGAEAACIRRRLDRIVLLALPAALAMAAWWVAQVAASMAGAGTLGALAAAVPLVTTDTWFGRTMLVRVGLLLAAAAACGLMRGRSSGRATAALLAAASVAVQPWFGHGAALADARGDLVIAAETVHVLAAGLWLGTLLPLLVVARAAPLPEAAAVARRFSALGIGCVLAVALSAVALAALLVGSLAALTGTAYGHVVLAKLGLLLALLACAALNRQIFTPALRRRQERARRHLVASIAVETGLGLLVVLAAGLLASLPPA